MAWTDLTFYQTQYLMGDTAAQIVPDVSFPRVAASAEELINWKNVLPEDFPDAPPRLQRHVCMVAELIHMRSKAISGTDADGEQLVVSFNNKGYGETFARPFEEFAKMSATEFECEIVKLTMKRFNNTELHNELVSTWAGSW